MILDATINNGEVVDIFDVNIVDKNMQIDESEIHAVGIEEISGGEKIKASCVLW